MTEPNVYITVSLAALAGLAMLISAGLSGWRSWLALKRTELDQGRPIADAMPCRWWSGCTETRVKETRSALTRVITKAPAGWPSTVA